MGAHAQSGRHSHAAATAPRRRGRLWAGLGVLVLVAAALTVGAQFRPDRRRPAVSAASAHPSSSAPPCARTLRVVTATSFAPVLTRMAQVLASGPDCVGLRVTTADGQGAAAAVVATRADAWIPDDASWANLPSPISLATGGDNGATLATSPLYFVTSGPSGLPASARTWDGLAATLATQGPTRLVLRNPVDSGDGMVAGTALTNAVIATKGPLVSAYDLMRAWQAARTTNSGAALPTRTGELGIVPEYALLRAGALDGDLITAPSGAVALMRFTWLPTKAASVDPRREPALDALFQALTGPAGKQAIAAIYLRPGPWPAPVPAAAAADHLPPQPATALPVSVQHAMWHVLTTWDPAQRKANLLVVVDVSGSMADPAAGSSTPLITLVRQGIAQVDGLLPASASLGLWQFGSQLAPPKDYQSLVAPAPLTPTQRAAVARATNGLAALSTGTGLYDTILDAYRYQQAHYQSGLPNEVLVFTDGVNEDDSASISLSQLTASLAGTDRTKPVQVGVFAFGNRLSSTTLADALAPVSGQVDALSGADEVVAAFVHAVSGGLTH